MKEQIEKLARDICHLNVSCDECTMLAKQMGQSKERYCKAMQYAKRAYEKGYRKQSEWISVKDRLPERGQAVLCYRGDFRGDMMNTYVYLGSGNWEDDYGYRGTAEHEGITHWMPLPEPPKMKGGAE